jgi:hypothetical protein
MTRDSLPPLLRGVGTTVVLIAAVVAFVVARRDVEKHRLKREAIQVQASAQRQPDRDFGALASEIHELRTGVEHESIAEEVLENRCFEWAGFLGMAMIAGSFYAEWYIRNSKPT